MALSPVAYKPYADPDDFIREVTDLIWVQRDVAFIVDNYEPDAIVHGALGTTLGRQGVIDGSLVRIAQTPQRVGPAEDVVWEARGDDAFLSSHLVLSVDRNQTGVNSLTFPFFRSRTIANCLYRRGRMVEEWVVRDSLAGAIQNGVDPEDAARQVGFTGYQGSWTDPAPTDVLVEGDSGPRADDYRPECEMVLEFVDQVWNGRHLNRVGDFMVRDLTLQTVGDTTVIRPDGYQRDLLDLVAPFPDATFSVRDVQTNYAERYAGLRIALLWQMKGTYRGRRTFGDLTYEPVDLMGISQFLVQRGRIVREVRVYDQIGLRAQINGSRGDGLVDSNANIY
jgi:hypothetical protein